MRSRPRVALCHDVSSPKLLSLVSIEVRESEVSASQHSREETLLITLDWRPQIRLASKYKAPWEAMRSHSLFGAGCVHPVFSGPASQE
jgi:hypothetical protein